MLSFKEKLGAGIATATMMATVISGGAAFADTSVGVRGNGFGSDNRVNLRLNRITNVTQKNNTDIDNNVNIRSNTGRNIARGGGDIVTGDVDNRVAIRNQGGINRAILGSCDGGHCDRDTRVRVSGNGPFSDNRVRVKVNDITNVRQINDTDIDNRVSLRSNTGNNRAGFGTFRHHHWDDGRNNNIITGDVDNRVDIRNLPSVNELRLDR